MMTTFKPYGGVIDCWCIHEIVFPSAGQEKETVRFLTGSVVEDFLTRWRPGDAMRSSEVVNFDKNTLLVETLNTVYQLRGPGRFSKRFPILFHDEVYRTEMLLSGKGHLLKYGRGDDEIYDPESGRK